MCVTCTRCRCWTWHTGSAKKQTYTLSNGVNSPLGPLVGPGDNGILTMLKEIKAGQWNTVHRNYNGMSKRLDAELEVGVGVCPVGRGCGVA